MIMPLVIVLLFSAVKEALEDFVRIFLLLISRIDIEQILMPITASYSR
jgi:hypothetical protein